MHYFSAVLFLAALLTRLATPAYAEKITCDFPTQIKAVIKSSYSWARASEALNGLRLDTADDDKAAVFFPQGEAGIKLRSNTMLSLQQTTFLLLGLMREVAMVKNENSCGRCDLKRSYNFAQINQIKGVTERLLREKATQFNKAITDQSLAVSLQQLPYADQLTIDGLVANVQTFVQDLKASLKETEESKSFAMTIGELTCIEAVTLEQILPTESRDSRGR
jgi:hypothetical protein